MCMGAGELEKALTLIYTSLTLTLILILIRASFSLSLLCSNPTHPVHTVLSKMSALIPSTTAAVHLLPCSTTSGKDVHNNVRTHTFFTPLITQTNAQVDERNVYECQLRGRKLLAVQEHVPAGFQGVVVQPSGKNTTGGEDEEEDSEGNNWRADENVAPFTSFFNWKHDAAPTESDGVTRALQWLDVAEAVVNAPVSVDDVNKCLLEGDDAFTKALALEV